jgi:hypothetical protein
LNIAVTLFFGVSCAVRRAGNALMSSSSTAWVPSALTAPAT